MILEVRAAVHVFPDHISTPAEMLDYIYKENLYECFMNLYKALWQFKQNGFTMISTEQRVRRSLNMENIINSFAEAKVRKVQFS